MKLSSLSGAHIQSAISNGEFPDEIINAGRNVAVIMTQSWCPQWRMLSSWLNTVSEESGIIVYSVIYDQEPFFDEFMDFKENVFGNDEVPYIRYYIEGKLVKETNYTSKDFFLDVFKK